MIEMKKGVRAEYTRDSRVRPEGRPSVSVVSIAYDDAPATIRELAERSARLHRLGVELIIVCASRQSGQSIVSAISGGARLIYGPADASERQLRALGLASATGDVVMLVDDPRLADDGWIERVSISGTAGVDPARHDRDAGLAPV